MMNWVVPSSRLTCSSCPVTKPRRPLSMSAWLAASLLFELGAGTSGPAEGAHGQGGEERGFHVVAHGIGDGELHGVAVDDVVEGVAADVRRRFQRSGDRELGRLTCQRGGKEPVLDFCRQVQAAYGGPTGRRR